MADTLSTKTLIDGDRNVVISFGSQSDGTGESDAVKVDLSALNANSDGRSAVKLTTDIVSYTVSGYNFVTLEYDRGTDQMIAELKGSGVLFFPGGKVDAGSAGTGDVVLTTNGAISGASYHIVWHGRKKY